MPSYIKEHIPLAPYTSLNVGGNADYFGTATTEKELVELLEWADSQHVPVTILGGGSNVLIPDEGIRGLVVQIAIEGVRYTPKDDVSICVTGGAGVLFDLLIRDSVEKGYWGLENLSSIPGTVGGAPIQNVGAYGVEVKDSIVYVRVYDRVCKEFTELDINACAFGYRDSIFKHEGKDRYIVSSVTFTLSTVPKPKIEYADLRTRFSEGSSCSVHDIRKAVCEIRKNKFPDWHSVGTAGSFFKNPTISKEAFILLSSKYPGIPGYEQKDGSYKIALGWVLDKVLSLKGYRAGAVGLYSEQALVLVNHGGATADAIKKFSDEIIKKIFDETGIHVEREVVTLS